MSEEMLAAARAYLAAGLSVIPICYGSKEPDNALLANTTGQTNNHWVASDHRAQWRVYSERRPTDVELERWFRDSDAGVGIVGGAVSGGLVRIDFEHTGCLPTWYRLLGSSFDNFIDQMPIVATPKGNHVYFRMADPPGHTLLCSHGSGNDLLVLSETQGEGCYCVAPPSFLVRYDESLRAGVQRPYQWLSRAIASPWPFDYFSGVPLTGIPYLSTELATQLLDAARFPGLWDERLNDLTGGTFQLSRFGLTLVRAIGGHRESWSLPWESIDTLLGYNARYELLLHAVRTAPLPPPSYIESEEGEEYDEDD